MRSVDRCPYRSAVETRGPREVAACAPVERACRGLAADRLVPREACEACCLVEPPGLDRPNEVVASLVYGIAARAIHGGAEGPRAAEVRAWAEAALPLVEDVGRPLASPVRATRDLIDASVDPDTFAAHLRDGEPFSYLRYGDGEWLSILGVPGPNCDGSDHLPETMGRELEQTLLLAARARPREERIYAGLHGWLLQDEIRGYLSRAPWARQLHWVGDNLFGEGLRGLATRRFFEAVRDLPGRKLLVGNTLHADAARALGCEHIPIPPRDCYLTLDATAERCRFPGPGLVVACAGMASECLLTRLRLANPEGTYVDCGHIFDAILGEPTRDYTKENHNDILAVIAEHYRPLFANGGSPGVVPVCKGYIP